MLCGDFILPESANYVSLFCYLKFAQLIIPYQPKLDKQVEEDLIAENQRLRIEIDYLKN